MIKDPIDRSKLNAAILTRWEELKAKVPALQQRYPPNCPDPDWCAGNAVCYWNCTCAGDELCPCERCQKFWRGGK